MGTLKYWLVEINLGPSNFWPFEPVRAASARDAARIVLNRRAWTKKSIGFSTKATGYTAKVVQAVKTGDNKYDVDKKAASKIKTFNLKYVQPKVGGKK